MTASLPDSVLSATRYADFRARLAASGCSLCPALCSGRQSIVVDRGNPDSRILIVGEAPGETEDRLGRAFVGRAGKVLDELFISIGLETNRDVLIANVVKCRPPKNRPPTAEEAAHCRPYLLRQIEFQQPAVVVLLGATAARHFVPDDERPMRDRVGRLFETPLFPGIIFQILYHPAFLLRDPRRKPEALAHLTALRAHLDRRELLVPNPAN